MLQYQRKIKRSKSKRKRLQSKRKSIVLIDSESVKAIGNFMVVKRIKVLRVICSLCYVGT